MVQVKMRRPNAQHNTKQLTSTNKPNTALQKTTAKICSNSDRRAPSQSSISRQCANNLKSSDQKSKKPSRKRNRRPGRNSSNPSSVFIHQQVQQPVPNPNIHQSSKQVSEFQNSGPIPKIPKPRKNPKKFNKLLKLQNQEPIQGTGIQNTEPIQGTGIQNREPIQGTPIPKRRKKSKKPKKPKKSKTSKTSIKSNKTEIKIKTQHDRMVEVQGSSQNLNRGFSEWKFIRLIIEASTLKQQFILLQETHRPGQHDEFVDDDQFKNWRIISSGQGGNRKKAGVAIVLSPECEVLEIKRVLNSRILAVHVRVFGQELMLTSCYAPDERKSVDKNGEKEHSDAMKARFWDKLEKHIESTPNQCRQLAGGDFNATIHPTEAKGFGNEHPFCCYTNSKETSFNGQRLLDLVACQKLFLENTYYRNKKAIHSWTFQSNNATKYKRRLDYFLTDRIIHANSTQCRAYAPLESLKTDHKKLVIKFKLRKKWFKNECKKSKKPKTPAPDVRFLTLDEEVRSSYQSILEELTLNTDFSGNLTINERDKLINKILVEACEKSVPWTQKSRSAPWMDENYIREREKVHSTRKNRDGLKKLRKLEIKLQNSYYEKRAVEINEAAEAQEVERFFRQAKDLTGALKKTVVRSACTEKQHVDYITSCFKDRKLPLPDELKAGSKFFPGVCAVAPAINECIPTASEITETMKTKFKLGKAPGSDKVFNELLRYATTCKFFMEQIIELVQQVWREDKIPDSWRKSIITLIYKKGKNNEPKNFRPVALIHCVSKIITKIIRVRASSRYHAVVSDYQFGFKSGVGTIDAIYCFRQLIQHKKGPIHCLFLDLRGAFDRLPREHLIEILRIMLGSEKIANLLADIHFETKAIIKDGSIEINIDSGVRQGSDEGPVCFNIFFEYVLLVVDNEIDKYIKTLPKNDQKKFDAGAQFKYNIFSESDTNTRSYPRVSTGKKFNLREIIRKILYADDLVLFESCAERLQIIIDILQPVFDRFGLIVAEDKTVSMSFKLPEKINPITSKLEKIPAPSFYFKTTDSDNKVQKIQLQTVDKFKYLGFNLSPENKLLFLTAAIQAAHTAFNRNKHALMNKKIYLKNRVALLETLVRPVLLYAAQAWDLTEAQKGKIDAAYNGFLRKLVKKGRTWRVEGEEFVPLISNVNLYKQTKTRKVTIFIEKQFLKFQAHVSRMPNSKIQKKLQFIEPEVKISENLWSKCGKYLGGRQTPMDGSQVRRLMQDRNKFNRVIDSRYGNRSTQNNATATP